MQCFPAYAPELNPVEYAWSAVKGKQVANLCAGELEEDKNYFKDL